MPKFLSIPVPGGVLAAFIARPARKGATPALLVLPEVFGVTFGMREICEEFAQLGYCAICPDLLWRVGSGADLTDATTSDRERAIHFGASFDVPQGLDDLVAIVALLRASFGLDGRVAIVGYGLGGLMAFLSAAICHPDATVAYYPVGIASYFDATPVVATPLLLQFGADDESIPRPVQTSVVSLLERMSQVEVEIHPGVGHAFARRHSELFDAAATLRAARYTAEFLGAFLK